MLLAEEASQSIMLHTNRYQAINELKGRCTYSFGHTVLQLFAQNCHDDISLNQASYG